MQFRANYNRRPSKSQWVLLSEGCKVNAKDHFDRTPLDMAASKQVEELLRSYGAVSGKELKGEGR